MATWVAVGWPGSGLTGRVITGGRRRVVLTGWVMVGTAGVGEVTGAVGAAGKWCGRVDGVELGDETAEEGEELSVSRRETGSSRWGAGGGGTSSGAKTGGREESREGSRDATELGRSLLKVTAVVVITRFRWGM